MKTLKFLLLSLVLFCLFSGNVLGATCCPCDPRGSSNCTVTLTTEIVGNITAVADPAESDRIGAEAAYAKVGDSIEYSVTLSLVDTACPVDSIGSDPNGFFPAYVLLPDGTTEIPLNGGSQINLCDPLLDEYTETGIGPYVISEADFGKNGAPPHAVRAFVEAAGISRRAQIDDIAGNDNIYTTFVIAPCVEITKTPLCEYSKVGDEIVWKFVITNCGDDPLEFVEINDPLLDGLLPDIDCGTIAAPLLPDTNCIFWSDPYPVTELDLDPVVNDVNVVFNVLLPAPIGGFQRIEVSEGVFLTVDDDDSSSVDLLHPSFTLDVTCEDGNISNEQQVFDVNFCNTGDVPLNINPSIGDIAPFQLIDGECQNFTVYRDLTGDTVCGTGGSATLVVDANATLPAEYCLDNVIDVDEDSATCGVEPCDPNFTVTKTCLTSPSGGGECTLTAGDTAEYQIVITNTSICDTELPLVFLVNDNTGDLPPDTPLGPLYIGDSNTITVTMTVPECGVTNEDIDLPNTVEVKGFCVGTSGLETLGTKSATGICCYRCDEGDEGCTPGFWKNHPCCWCETYRPTNCEDPGESDFWLISDIFTTLTTSTDPNYVTLDDPTSPREKRKSNFDEDTMMDALNYGGGRGLAGAVRNMLRHATAGLLNACNDNVAYSLGNAEAVINRVNAALESGDIVEIQDLHSELQKANEDGCPINARCQPIADDPD